jgi:hypothetical protein
MVIDCCRDVFTATLPSSERSTVWHGENTATSIVACIHVYQAVAWQRVDQTCYSI